MASKITNHLVVLNKEQLSIYKKQGEVINFLGAEIVQGSDFPKQNLNNQKRRLMFASNSEIHGKGVTTFHKLQAELRKHTQIDVFINKGMTHKALIAKMAQYDIIALTNDEYETYSLILIEAMILNKIIVASHKLGLIQNITAKYNPGELEDVGLFIFDHHSEFSEISHKLLRIHKAQTSEIYDKLALDHSSSAQRLIDYATRIQN